MTLTSLELVLLASLALAIGVVAALALARRGAAGADQGLGAELAGRLDMMARTQEAAKSELAKQLQEQERALGDAVAKRLTELSGKVGKSLDKSAKETTSTVTALRERLVQIDAAQKSLAELSGHVVGLRDILSNKQARGAFGEVMLEDLVKQVLPPKAYEFQKTLSNGKRADCLLILPIRPGPIVIDAKFPLEAWRALAAAADEVQRKQADRAFVLRSASTSWIFAKNNHAERDGRFGTDVSPERGGVRRTPCKPRRLGTKILSRTRLHSFADNAMGNPAHCSRGASKDVEMRREAGNDPDRGWQVDEGHERLQKRVDNLQGHFDKAVEGCARDTHLHR